MTNATVARRRHAVQAQRARAKRKKLIPIGVVVGCMVVAAVAAVVLSGGGTPVGVHEIGAVSVEGAPLPAWSAHDAAVGMRAPVARGISFDGSSATIPATGKPSVVVFIAHWCAHCQRDVAAIAPVLARSMPSDIAIMSVVTLTDPSLPNYPPSTWLKDKDWKPAVLLDDKNASVANAYGLQGTPLWVFIGKDGLVRFRVEGELGVSAFQQALARLRAGP